MLTRGGIYRALAVFERCFGIQLPNLFAIANVGGIIAYQARLAASALVYV